MVLMVFSERFLFMFQAVQTVEQLLDAFAAVMGVFTYLFDLISFKQRAFFGFWDAQAFTEFFDKIYIWQPFSGDYPLQRGDFQGKLFRHPIDIGSIFPDKFLALFAESRHAKALPFRSFQVKTLYMLCTVLAIMRIAFHKIIMLHNQAHILI